MRIAVLHNFYRETGGEDTVFHSEVALLQSKNHEVLTYTVSNERLDGLSRWQQARTTIWNAETYRDLLQWFKENKPDVAHFHNIWYVLSPAAYQAAHDAGIPVVQTLHNYRLICSGGQLLRNGKPCELCVGKRLPIYGVFYGCYRNSRFATLVRALQVLRQRRAGHWQRAIQVFIVLTEFAKKKFIQGGLPPDKLVVKPNFVAPDPGEGSHQEDYALFVGRLSEEKGVRILLEAWKRLPPEYRLMIAGDGPLSELVRETAAQYPNVIWLGRQSRSEVIQLMKDARVLVFPSICYEGLSMTLIESFATGLPVIASNLGSMSAVVEHQKTGWLFTPGDPQSLCDSVREAFCDHQWLHEIGANARQTYLQHYTAERNYEMLMNIYQQAIQCRSHS